MAETVLEAASGLAVFGLTYVGVTAAVSYLVQNEPYEANFVLKGLAHILPVKPSRIFAAPGPFIYSREYIACQGHNMTKCMAKFEPVMELSVSTNETVTIDNNTTVSLAAFWSTRKLEDTISYLLPEGSSVHTYTLLRYIFALVQDGSRFLSRKAPEFGIHNFEDLCFVVIYCLLVPLAVVVFRAEVWRFMKALSADVDAFCHKHFEDPAVDETTRKEAQHTERIASENDWLIERVAYLEVTQTPATSQAHDVSAQGMDSPTMWTDTFVDFVRANLATISAMLDTIEQKFCLEAEERVSKTVKDLQEELEASKNLNAEANKKAEKAATSLKRTATGQQQEANKHSDAVKEHAKTQIRRNKELSSTRDELERVKLAKTEALKTANDTSKIDIARLDRAIMALEEQVDAQSSEKKKLQKARDDALDTCEELQGDYENLEYHLEEVQATADEASAKVVDLEDHVTELRARLKRLAANRELDQAEATQTERVLSERLGDLEKELESKNATKASVQEQIDDLKRELESEKASKANGRYQVGDLEKELESEKAAKATAQKQLKDNRSRAYDNSTRLSREIDNLTNENRVLKAHRCPPPQNNWSVMGNLKATNRRLEKELADANEDAACVRAENASLKERVQAQTGRGTVDRSKNLNDEEGGNNDGDQDQGSPKADTKKDGDGDTKENGDNEDNDEDDNGPDAGGAKQAADDSKGESRQDGDIQADDGPGEEGNKVADDATGNEDGGEADGEKEQTTPKTDDKPNGIKQDDGLGKDEHDGEGDWEDASAQSDGEGEGFGMLGSHKVTRTKPSAQDKGKGKATADAPPAEPLSGPSPDTDVEQAAAIAAAKARHIRDAYPESAGPMTDEENVSQAIFDAFESLPKRGLEHSIWAPGNEHLRPGAAKLAKGPLSQPPTSPSPGATDTKPSTPQAPASSPSTKPPKAPSTEPATTPLSANTKPHATPSKENREGQVDDNSIPVVRLPPSTQSPPFKSNQGTAPAKLGDRPFDGKIPTGPRDPGKPPKPRQWGPPPTAKNAGKKPSQRSGSPQTNHSSFPPADPRVGGRFGSGPQQGPPQGARQGPQRGSPQPQGSQYGPWQGSGQQDGRGPRQGSGWGPNNGEGAPATPPQDESNSKADREDSFKRMQERFAKQKK